MTAALHTSPAYRAARRRHLSIAFLCCALGTLATGGALAKENRVALLIGNSDYKDQTGWRDLPNAVNDVDKIARKLAQLGFKPATIETDVTSAYFNRSLGDFENAAAGADVALFYYAGHGAQISGETLLLPTDFDTGRHGASDPARRGISLAKVLSSTVRAKRKIVILDMCRDNPLQDTSARGGVTTTAIPRNTVVLFSTQPGDRAEDSDDGATNSPFAQAVLAHISDASDFQSIVTSIVNDVHNATERAQNPVPIGALGAPLVLARLPSAESPPPPPGDLGSGVDRARNLAAMLDREQIAAPISVQAANDLLGDIPIVGGWRRSSLRRLLPKMSRPVSIADAQILLSSFLGDDRYSALQAMAGCLERPVAQEALGPLLLDMPRDKALSIKRLLTSSAEHENCG